MSAQQIVEWCQTLDKILEESDVEALGPTMASLQSSLVAMEPSEALVKREGEVYLCALKLLKDTLDNMTSVYSRQMRLIETELLAINKAAQASKKYNSQYSS